jgi:hypothetical protein
VRGRSRAAAAGVLASGPSLSRLARISANIASSQRLGPGAMSQRIGSRDFCHRLPKADGVELTVAGLLFED